MGIEIEHLHFGYSEKEILNDISLTIDEGKLTCILGPNGVGKSTLMYCINKLQKLNSGRISYDGVDLATVKMKDMAKLFSFVPHAEEDVFSMSVMDTVLMGRHPHSGFSMTKEDLKIAADNIRLLGVEDLSMRSFDELSAGQHQRVMIARGLTQEPKVLMLDEPTANLDVKYQMLVMKMLRDITRLKGITVLIICHDLNVTSMFADDIILLYGGKVFAHGTSEEVLTESNVETVYGVKCKVSEIQGRPHIALLDGDYLETHISASSKDSIEDALESEELKGQSLVTGDE
ncbi:MAG: ABC transporter ATP-binding protein [Candidatus Methanomethylophilaceae archaeon]|nr:ABC transporter ATP-binding protein [Candidatus Methanomethylophilaceae archaeon]